MSEATRSLAKEMEGSITCWNSMIESNSNKIHLVYSLEADDITFFNLMRYFPAHLQKNNIRVPIHVYCVEHTELIPFLKKESKIDFDESPYAILYEHNGTYHQYTGPRLKQHYDMDTIVKWIQDIQNSVSTYPEFPEFEINWLHSLDSRFREQVPGSSTGFVFSVDILPYNLKAWVKKNYRYTDYVNLGPSMGVSDGMIWSIWGWDDLPNSSTSNGAAWSCSIKAKQVVPSKNNSLTKTVIEKLNATKTHIQDLELLLKHLTA